MQWTRSEWISLKLATIELMKRIITPKSKVEVEKRGPKPPVYDPEEDALYDFEEADDVVDEMDMDDLDDVKLDIECCVCCKQYKHAEESEYPESGNTPPALKPGGQCHFGSSTLNTDTERKRNS